MILDEKIWFWSIEDRIGLLFLFSLSSFFLSLFLFSLLCLSFSLARWRKEKNDERRKKKEIFSWSSFIFEERRRHETWEREKERSTLHACTRCSLPKNKSIRFESILFCSILYVYVCVFVYDNACVVLEIPFLDTTRDHALFSLFPFYWGIFLSFCFSLLSLFFSLCFLSLSLSLSWETRSFLFNTRTTGALCPLSSVQPRWLYSLVESRKYTCVFPKGRLIVFKNRMWCSFEGGEL